MAKYGRYDRYSPYDPDERAFERAARQQIHRRPVGLQDASFARPGYQGRLNAQFEQQRASQAMFPQEQEAVGGADRTPMTTGVGQPQFGQQGTMESLEVQKARQKWAQSEEAKNLMRQGAAGVSFGATIEGERQAFIQQEQAARLEQISLGIQEQEMRLRERPQLEAERALKFAKEKLQFEKEQTINNIINEIAGETEIEPQTLQADNQLLSAKTIQELRPESVGASSLLAEVSPDVRNKINNATQVNTLGGVMGIAKTMGVSPDESGIMSVSEKTTREYRPRFDELAGQNVPIQKAIKTVLDESGVKKGDALYNKTAMAIAYSAANAYQTVGQNALSESQNTIQANNANNLATAVNAINRSALEGDMMYRSTIAGLNQANEAKIGRLTTLMQHPNTEVRGVANMKLEQIRQQIGINPTIVKDIPFETLLSDFVIQDMINKNSGNPSFMNYLERERAKIKSGNLERVSPELLQAGQIAVSQLKNGANMETLERVKIMQDNEKKNLFTEFDDKGNAVTFGTAEEAEQYRRAPSWKKEGIAENAKARIRYRLGNEANRTHLENRLDKIQARMAADRANIYLSEDEKEIREATNQPIIDEIKADLDRLDRIDVKLSTPLPPEDNEIPVLTPEEVRNAPIGTKFRTTDGRIGTRQ